MGFECVQLWDMYKGANSFNICIIAWAMGMPSLLPQKDTQGKFLHLAPSLVVKKLWIEGRKVDFIGGLCKHNLRRVGIRIRVYMFKDQDQNDNEESSLRIVMAPGGTLGSSSVHALPSLSPD